MMKLNKNVLKFTVEFVGTLFFIGAIILSKGNAFVIGAALAVAIYLGGNITGGHFNPAVSLTMYIKKNLPMNQLIMYVIAQTLGGLASLRVAKMIV